MPGKVTYPVAKQEPEEPGGARKTALSVAAGILVTDASGPEPVVAGHGEVEHVRFEDVEAAALESLTANPALHYGTPGQRAKAAYELHKKAGAEAEASPAAAGPSPVLSPSGEEAGLSTLAKRLSAEPHLEATFREAINELDQKAIDEAAIENLYGDTDLEDAVDAWAWPEETDQDAGGEAA